MEIWCVVSIVREDEAGLHGSCRVLSLAGLIQVAKSGGQSVGRVSEEEGSGETRKRGEVVVFDGTHKRGERWISERCMHEECILAISAGGSRGLGICSRS